MIGSGLQSKKKTSQSFPWKSSSEKGENGRVEQNRKPLVFPLEFLFTSDQRGNSGARAERQRWGISFLTGISTLQHKQRGLDFALVQARHSSKVISYFATKALSTSLFLGKPGLEEQTIRNRIWKVVQPLTWTRRSQRFAAIWPPWLIFKPNACKRGSQMAQDNVRVWKSSASDNASVRCDFSRTWSSSSLLSCVNSRDFAFPVRHMWSA